MSRRNLTLAAVEGGGTTFVVSVARTVPKSFSSSPSDDIVPIDPSTNLVILHTASIPSSSLPPSETLRRCAEFLRFHRPAEGYDALGVATFGPVGVDPSDPLTYGRILPGSPKKEWRDVDVLSPLLRGCGSSPDADDSRPVPHRLDTDVNAPALAEFARIVKSGCGQSGGGKKEEEKPLTSLAYVTVGTGVGVGLVVNSLPVHGMMHPEGGHVAIAPLDGDEFGGYSWGARSPYSGINTVEGLTSSVALTERLEWSKNGDGCDEKRAGGDDAEMRDALKNLPDDHPIWDHAANALANLCVLLALLVSVEKIVLGGGVMRRTVLFDMVRKQTKKILNGYLDLPQVTTEEGLGEFIAGSAWGDRAGLVGAFALAMSATMEENSSKDSARPTTHNKEGGRVHNGWQSFTAGFVVASFLGVTASAMLLRAGRSS